MVCFLASSRDDLDRIDILDQQQLLSMRQEIFRSPMYDKSAMSKSTSQRTMPSSVVKISRLKAWIHKNILELRIKAKLINVYLYPVWLISTRNRSYSPALRLASVLYINFIICNHCLICLVNEHVNEMLCNGEVSPPLPTYHPLEDDPII
jgi:hypothetical protein